MTDTNMGSDTTILEAIHLRFQDVFENNFDIDKSLGRYTSSRVGGPAEMLVTVTNTSELLAAVELAFVQNLPYFVLGGGSNILISDEGIDGLVVLNRAREVRFRHTGYGVVCTVESGANLSSLARQCITKGLGGLEWAVSIPGTIGGAVVGNAGAHGSDVAGILTAATIWEPGKGVRIFSNEELEYDYRDSILKREQEEDRPRRVVLSAELELKPEDVDVLVGRADGFVAHRKQTQPGGASLGSMFKNPENYYAGHLIEAAGLKGFRCGGAYISEKHANFFICEEDATAEDVRLLLAEAWNSVRDQFGIELQAEVELVGQWRFDEGQN